MRARDRALERHFVDLAARAAGLTHDHGIRAFADARTLPGPIRIRPWGREVAEELADAANYASWQLEEVHDAYLAGEPRACATHAKFMRVLTGVMVAWVALTEPDD